MEYRFFLDTIVREPFENYFAIFYAKGVPGTEGFTGKSLFGHFLYNKRKKCCGLLYAQF